VFWALSRDALTAPDIDEARRRSIERLGVSFSSQAWALREKILEADAFGRDPRIREVHPEVSFCAMAGEHLAHPKSSWAGVMLRRRLLASNGIELPDELGAAGVAGVDDVLDAAAAAWSANRIATGVAASLPSEPEVASDGHRAAIWY
jgi:predicted RNase H-like nuclease